MAFRDIPPLFRSPPPPLLPPHPSFPFRDVPPLFSSPPPPLPPPHPSFPFRDIPPLFSSPPPPLPPPHPSSPSRDIPPLFRSPPPPLPPPHRSFPFRDIPPLFSSPPPPLPPPHPSSPQNHPLSLSHLVALSFVCLILLIIICTIIRKSLSHSNNSATEPAPHIRIPADAGTRTGLSQQVINSISKFNYKKGDGLIQATECSVCLSEFRNNDPLRLLPNCRHAFHCHCIDPWLKSNSSCPVCRTRIVSAEHGGSSSTDPNYRSGGVLSDQSFVPVDVGELDAEDRRMDIEAVKSRSPSPQVNDGSPLQTNLADNHRSGECTIMMMDNEK